VWASVLLAPSPHVCSTTAALGDFVSTHYFIAMDSPRIALVAAQLEQLSLDNGPSPAPDTARSLSVSDASHAPIVKPHSFRREPTCAAALLFAIQPLTKIQKKKKKKNQKICEKQQVMISAAQ
jgi:hypothetical protein